jgi:hypothetical protein
MGVKRHGSADRATRWWPPFCAVVEVVLAVILAVAILAEADCSS